MTVSGAVSFIGSESNMDTGAAKGDGVTLHSTIGCGNGCLVSARWFTFSPTSITLKGFKIYSSAPIVLPICCWFGNRAVPVIMIMGIDLVIGFWRNRPII